MEKLFLTQETLRLFSQAEPKSKYIDVNFEEVSILVDIGCGNGLDLSYMQRNCNFVVGLDIDPGLLNIAKNHVNQSKSSFLRADATKLPFRTNVFDVIMMFDVLEHLPSPSNVLSELLLHLRETGFLFLGVPNKYTIGELLQRLLNYLDKIQGVNNLWAVHHVNFFGIHDIKLICDKINLKMYEVLVIGKCSLLSTIFSITVSLFAHILFLSNRSRAKWIENVINRKKKRKQNIIALNEFNTQKAQFFFHEYLLFTLCGVSK